jgi:predicted CXXCH cytochrome family protein
VGATVRFITRRADGRARVRSKEVEGDVLVVGRDAACDVVLPDLEIALQHLRITRTAPDLVQVQAERGQSFRVHDRAVEQANLRIDTPSELQVADYLLTLREVEGRLDVAVEPVARPGADEAGPDEEKIFSLRGTWLSKRGMAWTLSLLILAGFLVFPLATYLGGSGGGHAPKIDPMQVSAARVAAGRLSSPGPLSSPHGFLARDCATCHAGWMRAVSDASCLSCHKGLEGHADPARLARAQGHLTLGQSAVAKISAAFGRPAGRCASCHVEHMGDAALKPQGQEFCASCHGALRKSLGDTRLGPATDFFSNHPQFHPTLVAAPGGPSPVLTRRWSVDELQAAMRLRERYAPPYDATRCDGFSIGQPNFRGLAHANDRGDLPAAAKPGDNSGLIFPHALHLSSKGCVATLAAKLRLPTDAKGGLPCASCHQADQSGRGFAPVAMEKACASCHSLVFDQLYGVPRTLPHGEPQAVVATMLDFYKAEAVRVAQQGDAGERHRPGQAALDRASDLRQVVVTTANQRALERVRAIFSPGGACYGCHEVIRPAAPTAINYDIAPVAVRNQLLPFATFDHRAHATAQLDCEQCHAARQSRSSTDVLLPGIETCRTCHGGQHQYAAVASPCVSCHKFHGADASAPLMQAHAMSPQQISRAEAPIWPSVRTAPVGASKP